MPLSWSDGADAPHSADGFMVKTTLIDVGGLSLAANMSGDSRKPALLLLHGWPHSRALFDDVLEPLSSDFFVLAPDLPGIGESHDLAPSAEKTVLANIVLSAAQRAGARDMIVAGLDVVLIEIESDDLTCDTGAGRVE